MLRMKKFCGPTIFCFWVLIVLLGFANPALSQLSLVSSTPSDGETNVGVVATFIFTFSEALDTTATFEEAPDFLPFLALELYPDSAGTPENVVISVDLKTITIVNVPLPTDTRFFLFLSGARSSTGEGLDRPHAITFTTGNILPTATVSGTINYTGGDAGGTAIALFEQAPFSDEGGGIVAGGVVPIGSGNLGNSTTLGTGSFTINYVPAGEYLVLAFKDVNMDGEQEFTIDPFGGYDSNADKVADFITVGDGANIGSIDMDITISPMVTAGENSLTSETIVKTQAADAELTAIVGGDLSPNGDGLAQFWSYLYYSASEDSLFSIVYLGDLFFLTPFVFGDDGDSGDGGPQPIISIPLPDNWIDSDLSADSAWANGGAEFVSSNPDPEISAFLFNLPFIDQEMINNPLLLENNSQYKDPNYLNHFKKVSADTDTVAIWIFSFFSDSTGQFFGIGIDALTGAPIELGPVPVFPTTVTDNLDAANTEATNWASDAVLIFVVNAVPDLSPDGFSTFWIFGYFSASKDSIRNVSMASGDVISSESGTKDNVPSLDALPANFCNSTEALTLAEQNSGDFRNVHPNTLVTATLSRGQLPGDSAVAVWKITYFSPSDFASLELFIDAVTCGIVTDVENSDLADIPSKYDLEQNYPNPFNPETVISYQVPQPGNTKLVIYNQLGQVIRILVNEIKNAGAYKAIWNGLDQYGNQVPNGVYFYRLNSNEFTQTKKMVLLR